MGATDNLAFVSANMKTKKKFPKKKNAVSKPPSIPGSSGSVSEDEPASMFETIRNPIKTTSRATASRAKQKAYESDSDGSDTSSIISSNKSDNSSEKSDASSVISASEGSVTSARSSQRSRRNNSRDLQNEKIELLARITGLNRSGYPSTKKFTVKDDLDEIRYECYRLQRESNLKRSTKFMQKGFVSMTAFLEMLNQTYDPFRVNLDGFSKSIMLSIDEYTEIFEDIHHKWTGKSRFPPELHLVIAFVSSAVFHHAGNCMKDNMKSSNKKTTPTTTQGATATPGTQGPAAPDLASIAKMLSTMSSAAGGGGGGSGMGSFVGNTGSFGGSFGVPNSTNGAVGNTSSEQFPKRKAMRGPNIAVPPAVAALAGGLPKPSFTI
jgi:hypothetical protein